MEVYKVEVSGPAEKDLIDIVRYISSQFSAPITALGMLVLLEESMLKLMVMPQKYALLTDERLALMGYRKLLVKNYFIFFTINEEAKVVDIERILYARRDWRHIL